MAGRTLRDATLFAGVDLLIGGIADLAMGLLWLMWSIATTSAGRPRSVSAWAHGVEPSLASSGTTWARVQPSACRLRYDCQRRD